MIAFMQADSKKDLEGILHLQKANLATNLSAVERQSQGFVTVMHTYEQLSKLNDDEKHIVAKDNDTVVGYLLAMTQKSKSDIPVLIPMFNIFNELFVNGRSIADHTYIVVGQVCIDKLYRGQGLLDQCYAAYKKYYRNKYTFAITEIATANARSLNAHKRIGFETLKTYKAPDNVEWEIVVWDWQNAL